MKIRVDFTVEIDPAHLERLKAFFGDADTLDEVRASVRLEACGYLLEYLDGANIRARLARDQYEQETAYAW